MSDNQREKLIQADRSVTDEIAEAVENERERCARLAETHFSMGYIHPDDLRKGIAARIRSGK